MKTNIWIDTDPGIDDSIAIAAAIASSDRLNLCGISTVAGNQTVDKVSQNALWLTELYGRPDIPVVMGADRPLIREMRPAGDIHGEYGLGYLKPGKSRRELTSDRGAAYIYQCIRALPEGEKITMVTIAPLTNIALLLRTFPDVSEKIEKIVCMGGSTVEGNVTDTAEFNIWCDPEAAEIVFQSGIPLVMCGLDVTMQCLLYPEDLDRLEQGGDIQQKLAKILKFYFDSPAYREMGAVAMHDSVPVFYVLNSALFSGEEHAMRVSCTEDSCRGMTVVRDGEYSYANRKLRKNVFVLKKADAEVFRKELMDALMSL